MISLGYLYQTKINLLDTKYTCYEITEKNANSNFEFIKMAKNNQ